MPEKTENMKEKLHKLRFEMAVKDDGMLSDTEKNEYLILKLSKTLEKIIDNDQITDKRINEIYKDLDIIKNSLIGVNKNIHTIKNCVVFFTVLIIIPLAAYLIALLLSIIFN